MNTFIISDILSEQELKLLISMFHSRIEVIDEWAWSKKEAEEGVAEINNLATKLNIDLTK
jgi:hypothetical protein